MNPKLEALKTLVSDKTARQVFQARKHSPKILFVAGTVGVVGTVFLACKATLKVGDILDQHDKQKMEITVSVSGKYQPEATRTKEEGEKALAKLKVKTGLEIGKQYLPALGLGIVSIAALTGSHVILDKRNATLTAGFAALNKSYNDYRKKVTEEYGADVDAKFVGDVSEVEISEKMADGSTVVDTKKAVGSDAGIYTAVFDETCQPHYSRMPGMNPVTLGMIQSHANDKLKARGHLFLNDVRRMLGMDDIPVGQIVGWIYDPRNPDHLGDNEVSFGIHDNPDSEWVDSFLNGHEKTILLNFNVDGPIWNKIGRKK
jgi:hypothetical protein